MGTGWVARMRHLPAYKRNPNVEVVAVFNPDEQVAKEFASKYQIAAAFSNLDNFLAQDLDLVSICTPPMHHFENAQAVLNAGKHVLLEKPITMTSQQAAELENIAKQKKLILCPAHNFLFCRAIKQAQELLKSGKIGEITGAMGIQWSSHKRTLPNWYKQLPGGLFFDESPHLFYLLEHFLGNLKVKNAWKSQYQSLERFEARLTGDHGEGLLSMWFGAPMSEWLVVVSGTKGAFILDIFRDALIYFPEEGTRTPRYLFEVIWRADKQIWTQMIKWVLTRFTSGSHLFGIDSLVNQLVDAVQNGSAPPLTPEDGRKIIILIEDVLKFAENNAA